MSSFGGCGTERGAKNRLSNFGSVVKKKKNIVKKRGNKRIFFIFWGCSSYGGK